MEGWSSNMYIWSRVVSWDDWTPSWIQSSKEATCKQGFCCRFSPATISKLSKTLHFTLHKSCLMIGPDGVQKTFKFATTAEQMFTKMATEIEVEFRQALLNLGPGFVSNISHSNRSLENSSPLWVLQSVDPQVAGGAPVTWEHLGFPQPGTCHWKPNYHDQPGYITVEKYCDSEPLILISLRWNFMFGITVLNATFTEPLKQAKVTVPLEERWQTAQLHALADSAPPPGWEVSQAPDAQKTHSRWQWAMQQNITYLRLNQTLATWILEGPHMFSESKAKISFVNVIIIYDTCKTCVYIYYIYNKY